MAMRTVRSNLREASVAHGAFMEKDPGGGFSIAAVILCLSLLWSSSLFCLIILQDMQQVARETIEEALTKLEFIIWSRCLRDCYSCHKDLSKRNDPWEHMCFETFSKELKADKMDYGAMLKASGLVDLVDK